MLPLLEQYWGIKNQRPNDIVLFRLGDFYEMFGQDALRASKILDIALTARYKNTENEIPMCGVPHNAIENYISRLTLAGFRVAICDQVSDPAARGELVARQITRVVTPGTTFDEHILSAKQNHYLMAIHHRENFGLAVIDVTTGEFHITEVRAVKDVESELFRLQPAEVLLSPNLREQEDLISTLRPFYHHFYKQEMPRPTTEILAEHFHVAHLTALGLAEYPDGSEAAADILSYLKETQKDSLRHINKIAIYNIDHAMVLDGSTIQNLELFRNHNDGSEKHSLISVIDYTLTALGGRLLRRWLLRPLKNKEDIEARQNAVERLSNDSSARTTLREMLRHVSDLERLSAKIACRRINPKELIALKETLKLAPALKNTIPSQTIPLLLAIQQGLQDHASVVSLLEHALQTDPPLNINEGGFIQNGFDSALDELRRMVHEGKDWIRNHEEQEKQRTGIPTLKIRYNHIFGYYIEITKSHLALVPPEYIRKQTLVNAERFVTPELKEYEDKVLGAEEKIQQMEFSLFQKVVDELTPHIPNIQTTAQHIAMLDVLSSFAQLAFEKNYHKPKISAGDEIIIQGGRHPVIETNLAADYIPNDLRVNQQERLIILTGPNMSGKSSYLRQNAIIILLAQIGCFVPAREAQISIVDRIFSRVGASDNMSQGQSTFMVEMEQAANIIHHATEKSFIIFDELGRGTSTYDGVSIAWATAQYVHDRIKAKTIFATHYHELIQLAELLPHAKNESFQVKETAEGNIVFLYTVAPGGIDKSYGIEVARLAGLPETILARAKIILFELSQHALSAKEDSFTLVASTPATPSMLETIFPAPQNIMDKLDQLDTSKLTPLEALNLLDEWKKLLSSLK